LKGFCLCYIKTIENAIFETIIENIVDVPKIYQKSKHFYKYFTGLLHFNRPNGLEN
jgi:hypothetical protein